MTTREKAHRLLDELPDSEIEPVLDFIASRGDESFGRWLDSRPSEDEEISSGEAVAVGEARDELAAGASTVSNEGIKREFGIE